MHVFGTCLFHDLLYDVVTFDEFECPFLHNFGHHFVISSTFIFKHKKSAIVQMDVESRRGHLGHILDKGGTGKHLGILEVREDIDGKCAKIMALYIV